MLESKIKRTVEPALTGGVSKDVALPNQEPWTEGSQNMRAWRCSQGVCINVHVEAFLIVQVRAKAHVDEVCWRLQVCEGKA